MNGLKKIVREISLDTIVDDGKVFSRVIQQIKGRPKNVIGGGDYDDRNVRDWIQKKGEKSLIHPPSNGVCHGTDLGRSKGIKTIRAFGVDKVAKSIWEKLSEYRAGQFW